MESRKKMPSPDPSPKHPKLALPAGACDTHFHIFGPQTRFPLMPNRPLDVDDATLDDVLALHQKLGFSRGLIVQSFQQGHCYEYMLHALSRAPERFRGVANPAPDITDRELEILTQAGVVAARYAARATPDLDLRKLHRLHEFGWQAHFMVEGEEQVRSWRSHILATPGKFVIEHMGWPPVEQGLDSAAFRLVLDSLDTGRCWVKLSPRFSQQPILPFADTWPFIHALVRRAPTRLLWGSDWPHPNYFKPMPNDGDLVDLMLDWVPDAATRQLVFTDNPAVLLGFPPVDD